MIEVVDLFADPSLEDWQEVAAELRFRSFVALPLQTNTAVLGTVTFYFTGTNTAGPETRRTRAHGRRPDGRDGGESDD